MIPIVIKRIYAEPTADDGFRVLVDRLWRRGVAKTAAALDRWDKAVAPSTELRRLFGHRGDLFVEFSESYRRELEQTRACPELLAAAGDATRIALLYAARDPELNHARVLRDYIDELTDTTAS